MPLLLDGQGPALVKPKLDRLLEMLGLSDRRRHRPDALSGGEQQRVAIARALINDPAVILADEPTGNLDSANSQAVCELLRDLSVVHNKTVVMVTHEPSVAAYAREIVVLHRVAASFSMLFDTQIKGRMGSPSVAGSTRRLSAGTSPDRSREAGDDRHRHGEPAPSAAVVHRDHACRD